MYRLKAYNSRSLPKPKSSRVHCSCPTLLMMRHGSTTVDPITAVCGDGWLANLCLSPLPATLRNRNGSRNKGMAEQVLPAVPLQSSRAPPLRSRALDIWRRKRTSVSVAPRGKRLVSVVAPLGELAFVFVSSLGV